MNRLLRLPFRRFFTWQEVAVSALLRIAAPVAALLVAGTSIAQDIAKDETGFTAHVAGRLRTELGDAAVTIKGPLTLGLDGLQANLDRIFLFCKRNADRCPDEVSAYVKSIAQVHRERNAPPTREAARIVVRPTAYLEQGNLSATLQPRPLVQGLVLLPVLDRPTSMRMLSPEDNKTLGLTADEVHELAISNLRAALQPLMEVAKAAGPGQIGHIGGDSYQSSRLALHDSWAALAEAQGGNLIVAVPATDAVFYVGEDTPVAIEALRTFASRHMRRVPNRLSGILIRWRPSGWEVVP